MQNTKFLQSESPPLPSSLIQVIIAVVFGRRVKLHTRPLAVPMDGGAVVGVVFVPSLLNAAFFGLANFDVVRSVAKASDLRAHDLEGSYKEERIKNTLYRKRNGDAFR